MPHKAHHIRKDVLANILGKGWVGLVSILFVPFFIKFLGVEAYGLVGFFLSLQTVLLLVDFGFSTTLNRALAACGAGIVPPSVISLATMLERLFVGFSLIILLGVVIAAPWLVNHWVTLQQLPASNVQHGLQLMGISIALQLPFMLYSGGLIGLGRQTQVNVILAMAATLRFGGALVVLMLVPRIEAFFAWQVVAVGGQSLWARQLFWRRLRVRSSPPASLHPSSSSPHSSSSHPSPSPHHQAKAFRGHIGFAAAVGLTSVLGTVLTQMDKLMLSRLLPLESYSYYMLAWTLCSTLPVLASTVVTAYFPRLSAEVAQPDGTPAPLYHQACQLLACALMPAGALLMLFPREILTLWLGNPQVVQQVAPVLTIMAVGSLLNTLVHLPHAMQWALGLARLGLYANIFMIGAMVPAMYIAVQQAGILGAVWVWVALNITYVFIGVPLMHCWILRGQLPTWLAADVLRPAAIAFGVVGLLRQLWPWPPAQSMTQLLLLALIYGAAALSCLVASPRTRGFLPLQHRTTLTR
jgi:O-antigen/teichoic acid export membrane protein